MPKAHWYKFWKISCREDQGHLLPVRHCWLQRPRVASDLVQNLCPFKNLYFLNQGGECTECFSLSQRTGQAESCHDQSGDEKSKSWDSSIQEEINQREIL